MFWKRYCTSIKETSLSCNSKTSEKNSCISKRANVCRRCGKSLSFSLALARLRLAAFLFLFASCCWWTCSASRRCIVRLQLFLSRESRDKTGYGIWRDARGRRTGDRVRGLLRTRNGDTSKKWVAVNASFIWIDILLELHFCAAPRVLPLRNWTQEIWTLISAAFILPRYNRASLYAKIVWSLSSVV